MISDYLNLQVGIVAVAKEYGDHLLHHPGHDRSKPGWDIAQPEIPGSLIWNNPENIASGTSGVLLFLLELYKQSKEEKYLELIDRTIQELLVYCKNNPTNNYSLYTGRAGVVYLLIQRHLLQPDDLLLRECLTMMAPAMEEYLCDPYTSDYLYDGRAGTLLVMLRLYQLTGNSMLIGQINKFINKIIKNAQFSPDGICWNRKEEVNLRSPAGFAQGTAGICYVLAQAQQCCSDETLHHFEEEGLRYIGACCIAHDKHWGNFGKDLWDIEALLAAKKAYLQGDENLLQPSNDYGWAQGSAGIMLTASNYTDAQTGKEFSEQLQQLLKECEPASDNLYNGLAGIGLSFLAAKVPLQDADLQQITFRLFKRLSSGVFTVSLSGGLLHGGLGTIYFLLKTIEKKVPEENILAPFLQQPCTARAISRQVNWPEVRKNLLTSYYPRTIGLLEKIVPHYFFNYLNRPGQPDFKGEIKDFFRFMQDLDSPALIPAVQQRVSDLFQLEKEKLAFAQAEKRTNLQVYLDELFHLDKVMVDLSKPEKWLLQQTVSVSGNCKLARTKWDWSYIYDIKKMEDEYTGTKHAQNIDQPPKDTGYVFQVGSKGEILETSLNLAGALILNLFERPKTIEQGCKEINHYVRSRSIIELENILNELDVSESQFLQQLDKIVLLHIRKLIYRNILTLH